MLDFLKQSRKFVNSLEKICIVIGNETCDLDSAVSAVTLAYFYHEHQKQQPTSKWKQFLPVLNIPRHDYPLKTEVNFLFNKYAILPEYLTFRDELKDDFLSCCVFILVDHHVSPFGQRCVEVFDHRPIDVTANLSINSKRHIELVGSCATLVAEHVVEAIDARSDNKETHLYINTLHLLRNTIILDTVNFSESAARFTPKDIAICKTLETILTCATKNKETREEIFQNLCKARADVSNLTPLQLLRKDLKIVTNANNSIKIGLPGFPLTVQSFINSPGAAEAVKELCTEHNLDVVVLLGMYIHQENGSVQRDIGLININKSDYCNSITQSLLTNEDPALNLQPYEDCNFMGGKYYKQNNTKATRKHILPIVKRVIEEGQ